MQKVLQAAAENPLMIPPDLMSYILDYVQTSRLSIPIGQVFGYQRIAPQVITDFAQIPSPTDGQIALLKVGSASPFIYVQLMYDQSIGTWVSEEFPAGGGAVFDSGATSYTPFGGFTGISWSSVHSAGLTMQLKWGGTMLVDSGTTCGVEVLLAFSNLGSGATSTTMLEKQLAGDGATHDVGFDWTTVADPGAFDMVAIGLQNSRIGSGTGGVTCKAAVVGRFIK